MKMNRELLHELLDQLLNDVKKKKEIPDYKNNKFQQVLQDELQAWVKAYNYHVDQLEKLMKN